jgi:AraC family transcriptional regulator of adaptative response / DNA-3-methyladenine glycosylase II
VAQLAGELGVSDRHLRRVLERELGVSPLELAQTHRLLLAKRLLADTELSVTRIAFASGFQSLRRFNSVFRERYRLSPSALRRAPSGSTPGQDPAAGRQTAPSSEDLVRLTLAYRAPLAWGALIALLRRDAMPGVELVEGGRYGRTIRLEGRSGVVFVQDVAAAGAWSRVGRTHLVVDMSASLLPVLMPLLARLRHSFDLDAEPMAVDSQLERGGLGGLVRRRPGLRIPGVVDGFEAVLRSTLGRGAGLAASAAARRVVEALGEPLGTGSPALVRLAPETGPVVEAGTERLVALGVARRAAEVLTAVARALSEGRLQLEPGNDVAATHRALLAIEGVGERLATTIVLHALHWPDAFSASDRALQRAAGAASAAELRARADQWRPWRAYAAEHLALAARNRTSADFDPS